jgi:hypothetical protein
MLALSDGALARLAISATALPPHARGRWLRQIANRIDPPPQRSDTVRKARLRQRERSGHIVLQVEVHEHDLAAAMIEAGLLTEAQALSRADLARALARIAAEFSARWLER